VANLAAFLTMVWGQPVAGPPRPVHQPRGGGIRGGGRSGSRSGGGSGGGGSA